MFSKGSGSHRLHVGLVIPSQLLIIKICSGEIVRELEELAVRR